MLTARGWWFLTTVLLVLFLGILLQASPRAPAQLSPLVVLGLGLALWFAWEWLLWAVRVRATVRRLRVVRAVGDERGAAATLWAGRVFTVTVRLELNGTGRLPYAAVTDRVPFAVEHLDGEVGVDGAVSAG